MKQNYERIVILYNLGSPASLSLLNIWKFLFNFLMDPCVIDLPFVIRLFLVGSIIVPFRSPKTKRNYQTIWTDKGSPLTIISQQQAEKLKILSNNDTHVVMRYGEPSLKTILKKLKLRFIREYKNGNLNKKYELIFMPLYPQFALSTTETIYRNIKKHLPNFKLFFSKMDVSITSKIVSPFYNNPLYIESLKKTIRPFISKINAKDSHLLFSYHGIPERHIFKTDPSYPPGTHCLRTKTCCDIKSNSTHVTFKFCYRHQTKQTTNLTIENLRIKSSKVSHSYQSRLGNNSWLTPHTDKIVEKLAQEGVKNLWVICPSFVADNLETLYEIKNENRKIFQKNGGINLELIPCLNNQDSFIKLLYQLTN